MSDFTRFSAVEQLQYDRLSSLKYKKAIYRIMGGYRYYVGSLDSNTYVDIKDGDLTDGATIPRILWWLLPPIDEYSQATSLHDILCLSYEYTVVVDGVPTQVKITRKQIDYILKEAMDVLEVTPWKKYLIMLGVNLNRWVNNPTKPKSFKDSI